MVADYLTHNAVAIGPKELEEMWRIETEQVELGADFYPWWWSQDAHDQLLARTNPNHKIRLNCETHNPPVLRPRLITLLDTSELKALSIEVLGRLGANPNPGYHATGYAEESEKCLKHHQRTRKAGPPGYVVMRKEPVGLDQYSTEQIRLMNQLNAEFGAGYEVLNSSLDMAFVALAIQAFTGFQPFTNPSDSQPTFIASRCLKNEDTWKRTEEERRRDFEAARRRGENDNIWEMEYTYPLMVGYHFNLGHGTGNGAMTSSFKNFYFGHSVFDENCPSHEWNSGIVPLRIFEGQRKWSKVFR